MKRNKYPIVEHHHGAYLLTYRDGDTQLIQSDWDYPATAQNLGWIMRGRKCKHPDTDGTVDCPDCGKTASEFIAAAAKYLDKLC
jgi:hypothetical protein